MGTSPATQATLWVVPTIIGSGDLGTAAISPGALTIEMAFDSLISSPQGSAAVYLATYTGISFQTQRTSGPGDFLLEVYVHRDFCGCWGDWFAEGIVGATFPTAKRDNSPNLLLLQPRGNNRHFEAKLGGFLGWRASIG